MSAQIREQLKLKSFNAKNEFYSKFPAAVKFLGSAGIDIGKLREHSAKLLGTGALTSSLLLSSPVNLKSLPDPAKIMGKLSSKSLSYKLPGERFLSDLNTILPKKVRPLTREEEKNIEQLIKDDLNLDTKANLEGEHLNTTYGLIGAEQHLIRFPGDTNPQHAPAKSQYGGDRPQEILKEGIAPGLGAWGSFAPSKSQLNSSLESTERWYSVVQTLYLPDWGTRQPYLRDWYKYRKLLIINTQNGKSVVTAIADAGPAAWTGKHFGGSPEVMDYLGGPRYKKGPVLVFFVDDPDNKVPLGPVEYKQAQMLAKI